MKRIALALATLMFVVGPALAEARDYMARWDQVNGSWSTGWVHQSPSNPTYGSNADKCGHFHAGCRCGSGFCGWYRSGQVTSFWPNGCNGPRWEIRCTVQ